MAGLTGWHRLSRKKKESRKYKSGAVCFWKGRRGAWGHWDHCKDCMRACRLYLALRAVLDTRKSERQCSRQNSLRILVKTMQRMDGAVSSKREWGGGQVKHRKVVLNIPYDFRIDHLVYIQK